MRMYRYCIDGIMRREYTRMITHRCLTMPMLVTYEHMTTWLKIRLRFAAFLGRQNGVREQLGTSQNVFVLGKQCRPQDRMVLTAQAGSKDRACAAPTAQERRDQHIGVQYDRWHEQNDSTCAVMSVSP